MFSLCYNTAVTNNDFHAKCHIGTWNIPTIVVVVLFMLGLLS